MNLLRPLFQLMAPAGSQASLSTLIFHRVLPQPDPLFPGEMHARQFDAVCGWLKSWLNVLPLDQAVTLLKAGKLPARAACITFDDGYADNHDVAMPILRQHGLPATFFIATGFLDGGRMWNDTIIESVRDCEKASLDLTELGLGLQVLGTIADRRVAIDSLIGQIKYRPVDERLETTEAIAKLAGAGVKPALMMSSEQVKEMHRSGMQIGAHTVSHPILMQLSDQQALAEIAQSKSHLEKLLGDSVGLFAYPNGRPNEDFNQATVELVRTAGFDAAVTTENGISRASDDIFRLRRFTPWDQSQWRFGGRLLSNLRRH